MVLRWVERSWTGPDDLVEQRSMRVGSHAGAWFPLGVMRRGQAPAYRSRSKVSGSFRRGTNPGRVAAHLGQGPAPRHGLEVVALDHEGVGAGQVDHERCGVVLQR